MRASQSTIRGSIAAARDSRHQQIEPVAARARRRRERRRRVFAARRGARQRPRVDQREPRRGARPRCRALERGAKARRRSVAGCSVAVAAARVDGRHRAAVDGGAEAAARRSCGRCRTRSSPRPCAATRSRRPAGRARRDCRGGSSDRRRAFGSRIPEESAGSGIAGWRKRCGLYRRKSGPPVIRPADPALRRADRRGTPAAGRDAMRNGEPARTSADRAVRGPATHSPS